ncbi:MAG: winged helix-turn-helix transcriptional regulator, partial [Rhodobacteraceae bacterium]|nr:winged helix-turn-helix transcriptional regulator [Paracoccaceae bacterium]
RAEALVEKNLRNTGLTVRMRAVLEVLLVQGCASVPEIALRLHIQRQYVQLMINDVISAGFAEKRVNPRHKRSPLIGLTELGDELIRDVMAQERKVIEKLAENYDQTTVASSHKLMQSLESDMKAHLEDTQV